MSRAEVKSIARAVDRLVDAMEAGDTQARFFFSEA
jgi:hypothetical protein